MSHLIFWQLQYANELPFKSDPSVQMDTHDFPKTGR